MNKTQYSEIIKQYKKAPIFYQPWYLNAVSGNSNWFVCGEFIDKNKWGVHPFYKEEYNKTTIICVPPLTQYMGPLVHIDKSINSPRRYSIEGNIISSLLDKVQKHGDFYAQKWGPWQTNWLSAYHSRFTESCRITFIVDGNYNYNTIFNRYSSQVRNKLQNKKRIVIKEEYDPELLYNMAIDSLGKIDKKPKYSLCDLNNLISACSINNGGKQLVAFSATGKPLASALFLEDSNRIYYYIAGEYIDLREGNAPTLLIDAGIRKACEDKKIFDFTGSMIPGVSRFYQSFGSSMFSYHMLTKDNRKDIERITTDELNRKFLFRF